MDIVSKLLNGKNGSNQYGSGYHKDVYDLGNTVLKRPKNFSRDEAERDLAKFKALNRLGILNTPRTWIEDGDNGFCIRQEKAQAELPDLAEIYSEELLFDGVRSWMDRAVSSGVLYTDVKPENYSVFNGEIMPHDLTGGGWVEYNPSIEDIQNTYRKMIDNFSSEFGLDRDELEYATEVRSPYFSSDHV